MEDVSTFSHNTRRHKNSVHDIYGNIENDTRTAAIIFAEALI